MDDDEFSDSLRQISTRLADIETILAYRSACSERPEDEHFYFQDMAVALFRNNRVPSAIEHVLEKEAESSLCREKRKEQAALLIRLFYHIKP